MRSAKTQSEARQRILETADRLFYQEGLRAVGIDRIIAEAGVAKMTLYSHFESKDELILAVLKYRELRLDGWFGETMERHRAKLKDPVLAFFAALKEWFMSEGFRGCVFINTSVELPDAAHPCSAFVRGHKQRFSELLQKIIEEVAGKSAPKIAPAVSLLVEGAIVTAVIQGSPHPADVARDAALVLIREMKNS